MEMHQIRYFLSLAKHLNFTRAAEDCNVSQPALTRAIRNLEIELGGELIRRERDRHLTDLGKRMLPLLERCYESASTARELAKAVTSSDVAPLSVAVSHSVNIALFMGPVAELFRTFPGLQLAILNGSAADVLEHLRKGDVEIALAGPLDEEWARLDRWTLFEEGFELVLRADHALCRETGLSADTLQGQHILYQTGCESHEAFTKWLKEHALPMARAHQIATQHDLSALVLAGIGIGVMPESGASGDQLHRARVRDLDLTRAVSVYAVAGRRRSPTAAAFLNLLRAGEYQAARPREATSAQ